MGFLSKGSYAYGNRSYTDILALTGMSLGDNVFDTTYSYERIYDGDNWVHGNQRSFTTDGGLLDGAVMIASGSNDNRIDFHNGSADSEAIIGIVEDSVNGSVGDVVPLTYHGDVRKCLVTAGASPDDAATGDYVQISTSSNGYGDIGTLAPDIFGNYIDSAATATGERRIIFRHVERF